jgi:SAM-dependent methyltransferase
LEYLGVDFGRADDFGYRNKDVIYFTGDRFPQETGSIDSFICTEVLEHVEAPEKLISEIYRVLKPTGKGVITVPWSARYHYIPFDYYRFTPTKLKQLCSAFATVRVEPRGSDLVVIAAKIIVFYTRLLLSWRRPAGILALLLAAILAPLALLSICLGHLALKFKLGSEDDPLGYTVWVEK